MAIRFILSSFIVGLPALFFALQEAYWAWMDVMLLLLPLLFFAAGVTMGGAQANTDDILGASILFLMVAFTVATIDSAGTMINISWIELAGVGLFTVLPFVLGAVLGRHLPTFFKHAT